LDKKHAEAGDSGDELIDDGAAELAERFETAGVVEETGRSGLGCGEARCGADFAGEVSSTSSAVTLG
jgi:hypothetical protein